MTNKKNFAKLAKHLQDLLLNEITFTVAKAVQHASSVMGDLRLGKNFRKEL
jgi:hypothetical protein